MNFSMLTMRHKPVVLGVLLDEQNPALLHTACSLAKQLGSPLELVHAVRPVFDYVGIADLSISPSLGYDPVLTDLEVVAARAKLEDLRSSLDKDLKIGIHVVRDFAADALRSIAEELRAGVILCGIQQGHPSGYFSGVSTAFSLASSAPIPVLILPNGCRLNFTHHPHILVADNLESEGKSALERSICFANDLAAGEICHAHVHKLSHKEIEQMAETVKAAMILGKIPEDLTFSSDRYIAELSEKILEKLDQRYKESSLSSNTKSRYIKTICFGNAATEIHKLALKHQTQIMIFGRHHLFHRQSFMIGKIPYAAMIEAGIATMIAPD